MHAVQRVLAHDENRRGTSTASIDAYAVNSIRQKLMTYQAYQELVLSRWHFAQVGIESPENRITLSSQSFRAEGFAAKDYPIEHFADKLVRPAFLSQ